MRKKTLEQVRAEIDEALEERSIAVVDSDGAPSAQAYEALRVAVTEAAQARRVHLAQLTELDRALRASTSLDGPRLLLKDMMATAGLERVDDPGRTDVFEPMDAAEGEVEVAEPAYVDGASGRVIRQGRLRSASAS